MGRSPDRGWSVVWLVLPLAVAMFALAACGNDDAEEERESTLWFAAVIPVEAQESPRRPLGVIRVFDIEGRESFDLSEPRPWVDLRWSDDGESLYALEIEMAADPEATHHLFRPFDGVHEEVAVDGMELIPDAAGYWAPGGDRVALKGIFSGVWMFDLDGELYGPVEMAGGGSIGLDPRWSPDGEYVVALAEDEVAVVDRDATEAWYSPPREWVPEDVYSTASWPQILHLGWSGEREIEIIAIDRSTAGRGDELMGWTLRGEFDGSEFAWSIAEEHDGYELLERSAEAFEELRDAVPHDNAYTVCGPCGSFQGRPIVAHIMYREEDSPRVDQSRDSQVGASTAIAVWWGGEYREIELGFDAGKVASHLSRAFILDAVVR